MGVHARHDDRRGDRWPGGDTLIDAAWSGSVAITRACHLRLGLVMMTCMADLATSIGRVG
jgi:hypothetical protein